MPMLLAIVFMGKVGFPAQLEWGDVCHRVTPPCRLAHAANLFDVKTVLKHGCNNSSESAQWLRFGTTKKDSRLDYHWVNARTWNNRKSSVQFPEDHRDVFAMTLRTHCANSLCVQADLPDDLKRVFPLF